MKVDQMFFFYYSILYNSVSDYDENFPLNISLSIVLRSDKEYALLPVLRNIPAKDCPCDDK